MKENKSEGKETSKSQGMREYVLETRKQKKLGGQTRGGQKRRK